MISFNSKKICPIGVDIGSGHMRMVQLGLNGSGVFLNSAAIETKPDEVDYRTPKWQHWAINTAKELFRSGGFKGKSIVTALPSDDIFIDPMRLPRTSLERIDAVLAQKLQKRLPFPKENAIFQHIVIENASADSDVVDVLTVSADREAVNRHLAIFEKAGLQVAGISIWPVAMLKSFSRFFCRRNNENDVVSVLLNVGTNHTNVVITRGQNLMFARSITIGYAQLEQGQMVQRLFSEIDACLGYFKDSPGGLEIGRLVFLAGTGASRTLCDRLAALAQRMAVAAQIGDVLNAVEINQGPKCLVDRRNSKVDWATAFGLSLEGLTN